MEGIKLEVKNKKKKIEEMLNISETLRVNKSESVASDEFLHSC